jgi:hypothetical protein
LLYLILDTNNWIYLANGLDPISNKHHDDLHYELLRSLKMLKDKKQVQVIVNDIIIAEWNRNKEHCKSKIKKLEQKLANKENAFKEIEKYTKADTNQLQEEFIEGIKEDIRKNEQHIQNVEKFIFNDCIRVEISQATKLKIFDLSINNQPPFHNNKNNVGDAAILLSAVEYLKGMQHYFGYQAFFISNNIGEYTDGKNLKQFHPQLTDLLSGINIQFERVLPSALNISKQIITEMEQFFTELADQAVKIFTWDLDIRGSTALMFLDVQYYNEHKQQEDYLTLCVAKDNGQNRPKGISFILPDYLKKENGIFLFFSRNQVDDTSKEFIMNPDEKETIRIYFENDSDDTVTARVWDGYVKNEETGLIIDVFQNFLEFDHVFVMYFNEDLSLQTISVPLFSFRQQYALLPN